MGLENIQENIRHGRFILNGKNSLNRTMPTTLQPVKKVPALPSLPFGCTGLVSDCGKTSNHRSGQHYHHSTKDAEQSKTLQYTLLLLRARSLQGK